jgi:hypothetical protein
MTKDKIYYATKWLELGKEAAERGTYLNNLGRYMEAQRLLLTSKYCYKRYSKSITPMLTRKKDRTLNILGAIFSIGVAALIVYLIIHKK